MKKTLRVLLCAGVTAAALSATATPAAAVPCWKITMTPHVIYSGPPAPIIVNIPTIDITDCV